MYPILLETRINGVIFNRKLNNLIIKRCLESKNNNNNQKKTNKKQQNTKFGENLNLKFKTLLKICYLVTLD